MTKKTKNIGYVLLIAIGLAALIGFSVSSPILQNEDYHNFSDADTILGIPNFWNVISNLPFLFIGILGLKKLANYGIAYSVFFVGIIMVAFGSGYYHLYPDSNTLVWDRLPMTVAFTALISALISEFINVNKGRKLLIPLVLIGGISILYWVTTGDLRLYALVQFYPIVAIPIILIFFNSSPNVKKGFWLLLLCYIIAKLLETFDTEIHKSIVIMSGHPIKHVAAAIGIYLFIITRVKSKPMDRITES